MPWKSVVPTTLLWNTRNRSGELVVGVVSRKILKVVVTAVRVAGSRGGKSTRHEGSPGFMRLGGACAGVEPGHSREVRQGHTSSTFYVIVAVSKVCCWGQPLGLPVSI